MHCYCNCTARNQIYSRQFSNFFKPIFRKNLIVKLLLVVTGYYFECNANYLTLYVVTFTDNFLKVGDFFVCFRYWRRKSEFKCGKLFPLLSSYIYLKIVLLTSSATHLRDSTIIVFILILYKVWEWCVPTPFTYI